MWKLSKHLLVLAACAVSLWSGSQAGAAVAPAQSKDQANLEIVDTTYGSVRGIAEDGVVNFKGIPYAAPPLGLLRWAPPQPPLAWTGVKDATKFGSGCPQVSRYGLTEAGYNEDCLFMNVTVPQDGKGKASKRPVLIWIYGGAFVGGSSALYPLDNLARRGDAIVVSFNYRLGVFGFMAHSSFDPSSNGGYGIEDQREAMRWVKRNISAFDGDPENVTIAGESAGAASVCMHLLAPKQTSGLFQKAIIQSAGCVQHLRTVQEADAIGQNVADRVGCPASAQSLACLRSKSPKELLDAAAQVAGDDIMTYAPSIGTPVVPQQGVDAMSRGEFVHVPILNGGNTRELLLYVAYAAQAGHPVTSANYRSLLQNVYGENAAAVEARYPLSSFPTPPEALGTTLSDFTPSNGLNNCLFLETGKLAAKYVPVFEYQFADAKAPPVTENPGFPMGAVHSSELPYEFPHFSNTTKLDGPDLNVESQKLAGQIVDLWMSFARDGRPVADGVPHWPVFNHADDVLWLQPGNVHLTDLDKIHQCGFWQSLYPALLR